MKVEVDVLPVSFLQELHLSVGALVRYESVFLCQGSLERPPRRSKHRHRAIAYQAGDCDAILLNSHMTVFKPFALADQALQLVDDNEVLRFSFRIEMYESQALHATDVCPYRVRVHKPDANEMGIRAGGSVRAVVDVLSSAPGK